MSCGCESKPQRSYYRYYDTPDGCNIVDKTIVTSRYGAITGIVFSTFDVLFFSHAVGIVPVLTRYAHHVVPLALMGATFSLATYGALRMREKDDSINYFIGGMACGPLSAAYLRSKHAVLIGGLVLGVIGMIKKESVINDYTLMPPIQSHMGMINSWRRDFTLLKDPLDEVRHTCGQDDDCS